MNAQTTPPIESLEAKNDIVYENERIFANRIAHKLIETPKLHIWMILIPVIFVFHFFNLSKASKGRKAFVHNYLITRRKTLEEVHLALEEKRKPDLEALAASNDVPDSIHHLYVDWLQALINHYTALLSAKGQSYDELVSHAYGSRKKYQEAVRRLNDTELRFTSALKPLAPKETQDATDIIEIMQEQTVLLRKHEVKRVFG